MLIPSRPQRTIARDAEVRGVGFIHGTDVTVRFRPAPAQSGVRFVRTDLPGRPSVPALIDRVVPSERRTTIREGEATVEMVEHVMAALAGLRVDNCVVEIDSCETPGADGSSLAFVEALCAAGTAEQDRERAVFVIREPVSVRDGEAVLTAVPGSSPSQVLSYQLDYGRGNPIGAQCFFLGVTPETFRDELASSRTFLLEAEAVALRRAGIGTRITEADLLIFGPDGPINNALRFPDECARHKMLDMVGDFALLGKDLVGHVVAHRSGHKLNAELLRALLATDTEPQGDAQRPSEGARARSLAPTQQAALDVSAVMTILPHRYPFLLVDRVLELEPGRRAVAVKNVSINEPFFQGHWPGRPIMPGVLIVEALAQAAGVMLSGHVDRSRQYTVIAGIDEVKIRKPVTPGDQLLLEVTCLRLKSSFAHVQGVARVGDQFAAEAKLKFVMVDADSTAA